MRSSPPRASCSALYVQNSPRIDGCANAFVRVIGSYFISLQANLGGAIRIASPLGFQSLRTKYESCRALSSAGCTATDKILSHSIRQSTYINCTAPSYTATLFSQGGPLTWECSTELMCPAQKINDEGYLNFFSGNYRDVVSFSNFSFNRLRCSIIDYFLNVSSLIKYNTIANNTITPIYDMHYVLHYIKYDLVVGNKEDGQSTGIFHMGRNSTLNIEGVLLIQNVYRYMCARSEWVTIGAASCIEFDNEIQDQKVSGLVAASHCPTPYDMRNVDGYCPLEYSPLFTPWMTPKKILWRMTLFEAILQKP